MTEQIKKSEEFFRKRMSELQKSPKIKKLILAVDFSKEARICEEYANEQNKELKEENERLKGIVKNGFKKSYIQMDEEIEQLKKERNEAKGIVKELLEVYIINLDRNGRRLTPVNELLDLSKRAAELLKDKNKEDGTK